MGDNSAIALGCALLLLGACDDGTGGGDPGTDSQRHQLADALRDDVLLLDDAAIAGDDGPESDSGADVDAAGDATVFDPPDGAPPLVDDDILEGGVPLDVRERFDEAPEGMDCGRLRLVYPESQTTLPRNIRGLRFQWNEGDFDFFRVDLRAGGLRMRWFTGFGHTTPEGDNWAAILRRAEGGAIEVRLSALGGGGVCEATMLTLFVDRSELKGAVYYWSTTDVGIMRLAQGDTAPEPFLTPAVAPEINCPACHAISRDGTRIAFTRTVFPPFGDLAASMVEAPRNLNYDPAGVAGYFPSFSPDNTRLIAGTGGQLVVRDTDDGTEVERLPMPADRVAGSPDWSWQGDRVVAAFGPSGLSNPLPDVGINQGGIAEWLRQDDLSWAEPNVLVPIPPGGENGADRPAYSPEGSWIAFEGRGEDPDEGTQGNASAELWILPAQGGDPIRLDRANQVAGVGNSWPKWAVSDRGGKLWLAFSSLRSYGNVSEGGTPQIWVTAIDRDALPGADPSAPAFWLPFQDPESGNHIPYWSVYEKE